MAESTLLTISIVMGLLVITVGLASGRLRNWRRYAPGEPDSALKRSIRNPGMWMIGALVACTVVASVIVVGVELQGIVGGTDLLGGSAGVAALLFLLALPAVYLLWGFYDLARKRGLGNAKAVGLSAWIAGVLLVGLVAFTLLSS